jgi:D-alanyl-D-alanine carboxypeptidase/D-alanyl-D-alanine-endopeptidase (penicillin-binding protein 4)
MDMNKYSSNFMAEVVLRTMGAEVHGEGTSESGLRVVRDYLKSLGIGDDEYTVLNGSGLSTISRLTASQLNAVLLDMAHDSRVGHEFMSSLSIAGRDGTLLRRLTDEPGRLRGKTGTINGIHCLTGYVEAKDGEVYAFSFLVNEVSGSIMKVKTLHDGFARKMFVLDRVEKPLD